MREKLGFSTWPNTLAHTTIIQGANSCTEQQSSARQVSTLLMLLAFVRCSVCRAQPMAWWRSPILSENAQKSATTFALCKRRSQGEGGLLTLLRRCAILAAWARKPWTISSEESIFSQITLTAALNSGPRSDAYAQNCSQHRAFSLWSQGPSAGCFSSAHLHLAGIRVSAAAARKIRPKNWQKMGHQTKSILEP